MRKKGSGRRTRGVGMSFGELDARNPSDGLGSTHIDRRWVGFVGGVLWDQSAQMVEEDLRESDGDFKQMATEGTNTVQLDCVLALNQC